tara:strand:- start:1053 stop:1694 length:642 start_codon:yes stop_codon:yes gene_type:complete
MSEAAETQTVMYAQLDQVPAGSGVIAESPLSNFRWKKTGGEAGVTLSEQGLLGHLILRSAGNASFEAAVEKVLGMKLPGALQSASNDNGQVLRWKSPDEWLLTVSGSDAFSVEAQLREAAEGHYAIVNVSGGQTILMLSGDSAEMVLMKTCHYDTHESHFPVGKVIGTTFAKSGALIRRVSDSEWELVIRRSFSDYLALWLQDAAGEYGLQII